MKRALMAMALTVLLFAAGFRVVTGTGVVTAGESQPSEVPLCPLLPQGCLTVYDECQLTGGHWYALKGMTDGSWTRRPSQPSSVSKDGSEKTWE